jgi:Calcineurin-like phosphoesterase
MSPTAKNNDLFEEKDEFTDKTVKISKKLFKNMDKTFEQVVSENTQRLLSGKTLRIGESKESTIIPDYWQYYQQFNSRNLPKIDKYYGGSDAEMKMTVLLRLFHDYLPTSLLPIKLYNFKSTPSNIKKPGKIFIVGDTHGSFIDTMRLIEKFKDDIEYSKTHNHDVRVIFIGDFVDRGELDIHNLLYIITFNLMYPENVLLLRGNHEEVTINANYGFGKRVMKYFSKMLYATFNNIFKDLSLISIINTPSGAAMCLHGGIPIILKKDTQEYTVPELNSHSFNNRQIYIDDMDSISQQILWNDPMPDYSDPTADYFKSRRGIGYEFGQKIFDKFCKKNNVQLVFRGHQVFTSGLHKDFNDKFITVFSASDYARKKIIARFIEMDTENIFNFKDHIIQELPEYLD